MPSDRFDTAGYSLARTGKCRLCPGGVCVFCFACDERNADALCFTNVADGDIKGHAKQNGRASTCRSRAMQGARKSKKPQDPAKRNPYALGLQKGATFLISIGVEGSMGRIRWKNRKPAMVHPPVLPVKKEAGFTYIEFCIVLSALIVFLPGGLVFCVLNHRERNQRNDSSLPVGDGLPVFSGMAGKRRPKRSSFRGTDSLIH